MTTGLKGGAPEGRAGVALAIPLRDGRLLVARRGPGSHLAGTWEFPGGKIGPGEDALTAARRELLEETGLCGGEIESLLVLAHDYPDRLVCLNVFLVREPEGEVVMDEDREWAWVTPEELWSLTLPEANGAIVSALRRCLPRNVHE